MIEYQLPPRAEMLAAFTRSDGGYDGVFITAVKTTGIFCRPSCPARKPRAENVEFFANSRDATLAGYRPCKRCRPLEVIGAAPEWLRPLLAAVDAEPDRRWRDDDLREMGLAPERVRRWFGANHNMTFHAYSRARRLGEALGRIKSGADVTGAALDAGYDSLSGFGEAFRKFFGEPPAKARRGVEVALERVATPLGEMLAGATAEGVCLLEFIDRRMLETQLERLRDRLGAVMLPGSSPHLRQLTAELAAYFAGAADPFTVPVHAPGTDFQKRVWAALREIPPGQTRSYGDIAAKLSQPTAYRAVARANGDNRIAILIPCHRVIGKDGTLTGYGGGLWRKRKLLEHERGLRVDGAHVDAPASSIESDQGR